ncbi:MAG TPA: hypothetical protein VKB65_10455 [Myxococcota bacterium]|nr:hypothetical protein [Myxococcota bacterium]
MRTLPILILLLGLAPAPARALTSPLYGIGAFGELYVVDPSDATTTLLGTVAGVTSASGLAWDPVSGSLWFADHAAGEVAIKSIDLAGLAATTVVTLDAGFVDEILRDLAILPGGELFGIGWTPNSGQRHELFSIDRATGAAVSRVQGLPGGLAALDADTLLYVGGDGRIELPGFVPSVDAGYTGDLTNRGTQMTYAADEDATYFLANCALSFQCPGRPLYRVDRVAHSYTLVASPDVALKGIAVPEPGVAALALAALAATARAARRRR